MPRRNAKKATGIGNAAIEGARDADQERKPPDAKVTPEKAPTRATENNEAPMGGAPVAFPAPSAQPTRKAATETERRAQVDVSWIAGEDDDLEWQRAGGQRKPSD